MILATIIAAVLVVLLTPERRCEECGWRGVGHDDDCSRWP